MYDLHQTYKIHTHKTTDGVYAPRSTPSPLYLLLPPQPRTSFSRRPATTGRMWKPLESRLPTSLLLASRPVSAKAAARAVAGDVAARTEGETTTVADANAWEGEGGVGDSTVWCFPSKVSGGDDSGEQGDGRLRGGGVGTGAGESERYGSVHGPLGTAQERALFGRKPSPAMVARSTSYAPR